MEINRDELRMALAELGIKCYFDQAEFPVGILLLESEDGKTSSLNYKEAN